jgi:hypothetical protein
MASVNHEIPTRQEAKAALDTADRQAGRLRQDDHRFGIVLLLVAAVYLVVGVLVALSGRGIGAPRGIGVVVVIGGGAVGAVVLLLRMRAYSRPGYRRFMVSIAAFGLWNGAVAAVSVASGWWGQAQPGPHFAASAAVAVLPLLAGAWLVGRGRR